MSGWHSLSGYLHTKEGGALGKLRMKRKLYYAFDEKECQLLYYRSQNDWTEGKSCLGNIDIKGAAIRLNLGESNQFVIMSNGKEFMLTADNHESMMIWLLGLQAKRDAFAQRDNRKGSLQRDDPIQENVDSRGKPRHRSEPTGDRGLLARDSYGRSSFQGRIDSTQHQRLLKKLAESLDDGLDMYADEGGRLVYMADQEIQVGPPLINFTVDMGIQAEVLLERGVPQSRSLDAMPQSFPPLADSNFERPGSNTSNENCSLSSSMAGSIVEEVFSDEFEHIHVEGTENSGSDSNGGKQKFKRPAFEDRVQYQDKESRERTRSLSVRSAYSDSGVSMDKSQDLDQNVHLSDLEQELLAAKLEIAKMKNQASAYQTILEKRDTLILELDEKLERLQEQNKQLKQPSFYSVESLPKENKSTSFFSRGNKKTLEEIRVLQNQNLFLNGEVIKLANLLQQEREVQNQKDLRINYLLSLIEQWKRDYVYLLQSTITVPTGDISDGMEVRLYGGDRHKERIKELLEEARQSNPWLPTFDKLAKSEVHVDNYGFKHHHHSEELLLHYICTQLHKFYSCQLSSYEEHQRRWKEILTKAKTSLVKTKELKVLCRKGIPPQYRHEMWRQLVLNQVSDLQEEKGPHYFSNLLNNIHESENASRYKKQISLDLLRTMPNNINFNSMNSQGIQRLQEVLLAFCVHNPEVGYCQGMNFIVAMCLLFMDAEDAFWALVAITERYFSSNYFDSHLSGAQADQEVLKELLSYKLPVLHDYIDNMEIEISTVTLNWFLAIFFDGVPFETLIRIWDCFLLEGPKVLFRFALAILKLHEPSILKKQDTISVMRHLKSCAALTFDVDGLYKMAFEGLRPFPRRRDIAAKQAVYSKTLKEKLRRQDLQRKEYEEKDQMFRQISTGVDTSNMLVFECATITDDGTVWVCYGEQNCGKLCIIDCENNRLQDIDIQVDSRILCICYVETDIILIGTLSKSLHAFSRSARRELWTLRLHDTVLSLACLQDDHSNILFAALADGTVAVLENITEIEPMEDPFHIPIGRCPITSVVLLDRQLWCACGNNVHVLHAETLDTLDRFVISSNPFDNILSMAISEIGVWIAVKGSAILELWDPDQLTCKMLYDVKSYKHTTMVKEDEGHLNTSRITTILPVDNTIWVGTGDGNIVMFEVTELETNYQSPPPSARTSPRQSKRWNKSSPTHKGSKSHVDGKYGTPERDPEMRPSVGDSGIATGASRAVSTISDSEKGTFSPRQEAELEDLLNNELIMRPQVLFGLTSSNPKSPRKLSRSEKVSSMEESTAKEHGSSMENLSLDLSSLDENANNKQFTEEKRIFTLSDGALAETNNIVMSARGSSEQKLKLNDNESHLMGGVGIMFAKNHKMLNLQLDNTEAMNNKNKSSNALNEVDSRKQMGLAPYGPGEIGGEVAKTENDSLVIDNNLNKAGLRIDKKESACNYQIEAETLLNQVIKQKEQAKRAASPVLKPETLALNEDAKKDLKMLSPICESPLTEAKECMEEENGVTVFKLEKGNYLTPDALRAAAAASNISAPPGLSPILEGRESNTGSPSVNTSSVTSPDVSDRSMQTTSDTRPSVSSEPETPGDWMFSPEGRSSLQPLLSPSISIQEDNSDQSPGGTAFADLPSDFSPEVPRCPASTPNVPRLHLENILKEGHLNAASTPETPTDNLAVPVSSRKSRSSHSRSPSSVSNASCISLNEIPYTCELSLLAKIKISGHPIRCLTMTRSGGEDVIVSCAGCYSDDESVLKWRREEDEKIWTNEPVHEASEDINPKAPPYFRQRSNSSQKSGDSCEAIKTFYSASRKGSVFSETVDLDFSISY